MSESAERLILEYATEGAELRTRFSRTTPLVDQVPGPWRVHGGEAIVLRNGGSLPMPSIWPPEFVKRFELERPSSGPALTTTLRAYRHRHDYGFELVSPKVQPGLAGDVCVGISTSATPMSWPPC